MSHVVTVFEGEAPGATGVFGPFDSWEDANRFKNDVLRRRYPGFGVLIDPLDNPSEFARREELRTSA